MARMSWRALRTQAGASVMASRTCWITGRTVAGGRRVPRGAAGAAPGGARGGGPAVSGGRRRGLPGGECAEVLAFGLVELQRVGDTVEHLFGGACEVAALHADVVVDAHTGEQRDFFAAQPFDAPVAAAVS